MHLVFITYRPSSDAGIEHAMLWRFSEADLGQEHLQT